MPLPVVTTARTPRHSLPNLFPGQSQKEAFINEAFARIDALLQPSVLGELAVPPASAANGESFIVAPGAGGEWAGHSGDIATWTHNQWLFAVPCEGMRVHDGTTDSQIVFTGAGGWQRAAAPVVPTSGTTIDTELRATVSEIVAKMHALGIFSA